MITLLQNNDQNAAVRNNLIGADSPSDPDDFNVFMERDKQLMQLWNSDSPNAIDRFVEGTWRLIEDFPAEPGAYQNLMMGMERYERAGAFRKARELAGRLSDSPVPDEFKKWSRGFLNRLALPGKRLSLQFTAVDGREVDLTKMRGKVVLVIFWGARCGPCKIELPRVQAAWEKHHAQGFEVIGISCDSVKSDLEEYLRRHKISWPQYFGGQRRTENKFTLEFGINGIPHMLLVDKAGNLRFDNVRANASGQSKGDPIHFEEKISALLAEQTDY